MFTPERLGPEFHFIPVSIWEKGCRLLDILSRSILACVSQSIIYKVERKDCWFYNVVFKEATKNKKYIHNVQKKSLMFYEYAITKLVSGIRSTFICLTWLIVLLCFMFSGTCFINSKCQSIKTENVIRCIGDFLLVKHQDFLLVKHQVILTTIVYQEGKSSSNTMWTQIL